MVANSLNGLVWAGACSVATASRVVAKADEVLPWLSGESEPATVVEPIGNSKHTLQLSSHELE